MSVAAFWFISAIAMVGGLAGLVLLAEMGVPQVESADLRDA